MQHLNDHPPRTPNAHPIDHSSAPTARHPSAPPNGRGLRNEDDGGLKGSETGSVRIVILTSFDDRERVYRAICNGAAGYLLKTADPDDILAGIRDVMQGSAALSSPIASMILEGFAKHGPVEETEPLTSREEEVLRLLVKGFIKKEIAEQLDISQHTVDMHLRAVYRKLHVRTQTEAVSKALRKGLV